MNPEDVNVSEDEEGVLQFDNEQMYELLQEINKGVKPEVAKGMETFFEAFFKQGLMPKDALGLTDAQIEGLYGQAYRLYNTGRYTDAKSIFRMLVTLNPLEGKYHMGTAACLHMEKKYESAIGMYMLTSTMDATNPIPMYHTADCYINLNELEAAVYALELCVAGCGDSEEYAIIKDRSVMMIKSLKKQLAEEAKPKKKTDKPAKPKKKQK